MEYNLLNILEATQIVKNEIGACRNTDFKIWKQFNVFYMQFYVTSGKKKEFYGHIFKIDFNNKELIPLINN
jgi:hypothetical protein